jgi:DNA-binding transcriptional LysR family regulator
MRQSASQRCHARCVSSQQRCFSYCFAFMNPTNEASPAYLARRGVPKTPGDLLEHDGIIYGQSVGGQEWIFRRGSSEIPVNLKARLMLSAAEGVREAVLNGQGFAICSHWMFAPELASGEVVPVLEKWNLPPMDLWVIYPSGRLSSAKARAFVKWFEKIISRAA